MYNFKRFFTEFLGTFILVFVTCGIIILNASYDGKIGLLGIAFVSGLIVLALTYALGHISGAHFNPAVTLAFASIQKFPLKLVIPYIFSQLIGGVLAMNILYWIFKGDTVFSIIAPKGGNFAPLVEFLICFILMMVIMGVATDKRAADPAAAGLPIGLTIILLTIFARDFSGAALNPARAFGPALVLLEFHNHWVYWLAPVSGMILAAFTYQFIRTTEAPKGNDFGISGPIKKEAS